VSRRKRFEARIARFKLVPELRHGAARDDIAGLDDPDAVAHVLSHLERVRAHEDGAATLGELLEEILQQSRALRVEADHRLVHHDHLGLMNQCARDDELLPHAMAVRLGELVLPGREVEEPEQFVHPPLDDRALLAVERRDEAQELRAGELVVDKRAIGNESHPRLCLARLPLKIVAADLYHATCWLEDAGDHAQRRRLPGAVGPEEAEQFAGRHLEIDAIDGGKAAVAFGQVRKTDHRVFSRVSRSGSSDAASGTR
jgi:hypothetical protein